MARKYSCTRSRRNKRRNTRRHHGGRGGEGGLGGRNETLPSTALAGQMTSAPMPTQLNKIRGLFSGGKRGTPAIHSPLHNKKTRKHRKH